MVDLGEHRKGSTYQEWLIRVDSELAHGTVRSPQITTPCIYRVPSQIRNVSKDSFDPQFFSFGLYDLETKEMSVLDTYRKDFAIAFMKITNRGWNEICSLVVGDSREQTENWVKLYDGLTLESIDASRSKRSAVGVAGRPAGRVGSGNHTVTGTQNLQPSEPANSSVLPGCSIVAGTQTLESSDLRSLSLPECSTENLIKIRLTLDAIFIVCFIHGCHQRRCHDKKCREAFPGLMEEINGKKALKALANLPMLDIFKLENQIPLGLIKNVVELMYEGNSAARNNCRRGGGDPFMKLIVDAVGIIYSDLPGPRNWMGVQNALERKKVNTCEHLLQCLYAVVCHNPNLVEQQGANARENPERDQGEGGPGTMDPPRAVLFHNPGEGHLSGAAHSATPAAPEAHSATPAAPEAGSTKSVQSNVSQDVREDVPSRQRSARDSERNGSQKVDQVDEPMCSNSVQQESPNARENPERDQGEAPGEARGEGGPVAMDPPNAVVCHNSETGNLSGAAQSPKPAPPEAGSTESVQSYVSQEVPSRQPSARDRQRKGKEKVCQEDEPTGSNSMQQEGPNGGANPERDQGEAGPVTIDPPAPTTGSCSSLGSIPMSSPSALHRIGSTQHQETKLMSTRINPREILQGPWDQPQSHTVSSSSAHPPNTEGGIELMSLHPGLHVTHQGSGVHAAHQNHHDQQTTSLSKKKKKKKKKVS